jgi:general transcription factor 3C polypeptide 3 (transcription factor C subunit 4)
LGLRSLIGLYTCHNNLNHEEKTRELVPRFQNWKADTLEDLAVLAKFFEDIGMEDEALEHGETVFKHGGGRLLQKLGLRAYSEIQNNFSQERKKARGNHASRKARVRKHLKKLRTATMDEEGPTEEQPLPVERPRKGYFRTRKPAAGRKPKTFLPVVIETLAGTNVPVDVIEQRLFRKKLRTLADEFPDELKAARAQHREIVVSFKRLEEISGAAEDADEDAILEFMSIARELIEEFSTFDLFYVDRREDFKGYFRRIGSGDIWKDSALMILAMVANSVEDGEEEPEIKERPDVVPQNFWGIHFDKWLEAFIQYAICLARRGEDDRCFRTIEVANQSNIFYRSQAYSHRFQICRLACALALDDSTEASSAVRWLMRTYPFGNDIFRLYSSVNRLCSVPDGYATGPAAKVLMRYIKTMDYALLTPEERKRYNFRGNDHTAWMALAVSEQLSTYVKGHDPVLFALYAYVLTCGGSYMAALNYYFRAYAMTPNDPVLNLSIGLAYIQHAMKRLSENRQFQIQQGLAFVSRYYDLRTKDDVAVHRSEAEFNVGRVWHSLGLLTQALPSYQRCVALSERVRQEAKGKVGDESGDEDVDMDFEEMPVEDFATEAAFAIQSIYALSGNFEAARKVTEEVLVIE